MVFRRLFTEEVARYAFVGAVAACPASGSHALLLFDDRLVMFLDGAKESMARVISYLETLPLFVYTVLASLVGATWAGLRLLDAATKVACRIAGFTDGSLWSLFRACPLCLAVGDVNENLDRLVTDLTDIRDLVTRKIRLWLTEGPFPISIVIVVQFDTDGCQLRYVWIDEFCKQVQLFSHEGTQLDPFHVVVCVVLV